MVRGFAGIVAFISMVTLIESIRIHINYENGDSQIIKLERDQRTVDSALRIDAPLLQMSFSREGSSTAIYASNLRFPFMILPRSFAVRLKRIPQGTLPQYHQNVTLSEK